MKTKEFNKIITQNGNKLSWLHKYIGIIKKYDSHSTIVADNEYFIFGNADIILPKMDIKDILRLRKYNVIIKQFNGIQYFCIKLK